MALIHCHYCDERGVPQGREHAIPRWLQAGFRRDSHLIRAQGRHKFGGVPRVKEVCIQCNTGPLKALDDAALDWCRRRGSSREPILDASPSLIARWLTKIAINIERIEALSARVGILVPTIPRSVVSWVLGRSAAPNDVRVVAAAIPANYENVNEGGIFGPADRRVGGRAIHLTGIVFYVVWHNPVEPVSMAVGQIIKYIQGQHSMATLELSPDLPGPVPLPVIPNPEQVGFGMDDERIAMFRAAEERERRER